MERRALADKMLDLCQYRAEDIARQWYKAISTNPRTSNYFSILAERAIPQAVSLYRNLKGLYLAENTYEEVSRFLDRTKYIEDAYTEGVPLHEMVYALVMMRRHIWLYAETQALFNTALDMYQGIENINRTLLLFDYIIHIVTRKYEEMRGQ